MFVNVHHWMYLKLILLENKCFHYLRKSKEQFQLMVESYPGFHGQITHTLHITLQGSLFKLPLFYSNQILVSLVIANSFFQQCFNHCFCTLSCLTYNGLLRFKRNVFDFNLIRAHSLMLPMFLYWKSHNVFWIHLNKMFFVFKYKHTLLDRQRIQST